MIGTIIITYIITILSMLALFYYKEARNKESERKRLLKENDFLQSRLEESHVREQRQRESKAYDKGLHDGRETDALYRQCLKKYLNNEQPNVMINGEKEE